MDATSGASCRKQHGYIQKASLTTYQPVLGPKTWGGAPGNLGQAVQELVPDPMGTICIRQMLGMLRCHCRSLFKFLPAPRLVCTGVDISQNPTQTKRGDGRSDNLKRWGHAHSSQQRATAPTKQTLEGHMGPISVKPMVINQATVPCIRDGCLTFDQR